MKNIAIAALAAAALLLPAAASADEMSNGSMMSHAAPATMLCRPPMKDEKPNAMMSMHDAPLVCKEMRMKDGKMMGPVMPAGATAAQVDQAWRDYLASQIQIPQGG
jgi:hypothetical protein